MELKIGQRYRNNSTISDVKLICEVVTVDSEDRAQFIIIESNRPEVKFMAPGYKFYEYYMKKFIEQKTYIPVSNKFRLKDINKPKSRLANL